MGYRIESNVDMPKTLRREKYPFSDMKVGDSFTVPKSEQSLVRAAASYHQTKTGRKYASRSLSADEVRVWRLA
jgi:hypothetical protein